MFHPRGFGVLVMPSDRTIVLVMTGDGGSGTPYAALTIAARASEGPTLSGERLDTGGGGGT